MSYFHLVVCTILLILRAQNEAWNVCQNDFTAPDGCENCEGLQLINFGAFEGNTLTICRSEICKLLITCNIGHCFWCILFLPCHGSDASCNDMKITSYESKQVSISCNHCDNLQFSSYSNLQNNTKKAVAENFFVEISIFCISYKKQQILLYCIY